MKISSVTYSVSGLKEARQQMKKLARPPMKTVAALEAAAATCFAEVQAATHIITGSLKMSEKLSTDFDGKTWETQITAGGAAPGAINDPVRYAIYERARGGDHDFLAPSYPFDQVYEDIIDKHLDGKI